MKVAPGPLTRPGARGLLGQVEGTPTLDLMHRPTGWRPTAFYQPNGYSSSFTNAAILEDGKPAGEVNDPVNADGILLAGRWVLVSYDEKWGHARYQRPDGRGHEPAAFPLAE